MFDPTKPVQTRDGRKARILATDLKGSWPIAAAIEDFDGDEHAIIYAKTGHCLPDRKCGLDLINVSEKTEPA